LNYFALFNNLQVLNNNKTHSLFIVKCFVAGNICAVINKVRDSVEDSFTLI